MEKPIGKLQINLLKTKADQISSFKMKKKKQAAWTSKSTQFKVNKDKIFCFIWCLFSSS